MKYIYLDESGDLGFNGEMRSSKFFIIVAVIFDNDKRPDKIVKKTIAKMTKSERNRIKGCLHAYKENKKTILKINNLLLERDDFTIYSIVIDKSKLSNSWRMLQQNFLYAEFVRIIFDDLLKEKYTLFASRFHTNKILNSKFIKYIELNHKNIKVNISRPEQKKGLQIADFVCWDLYQKYEHKNEEFYNLIKDKTHTVTQELFKGNSPEPERYGNYLSIENIPKIYKKVNSKNNKNKEKK